MYNNIVLNIEKEFCQDLLCFCHVIHLRIMILLTCYTVCLCTIPSGNYIDSLIKFILYAHKISCKVLTWFCLNLIFTSCFFFENSDYSYNVVCIYLYLRMNELPRFILGNTFIDLIIYHCIHIPCHCIVLSLIHTHHDHVVIDSFSST